MEAFTLCRFNIKRQNSILPLGHQPRSVILKVYEMYLLFFLSMKEQVINSLRPVGKWIQIPRGGAELDLDN